jgi:hypothetical protein
LTGGLIHIKPRRGRHHDDINGLLDDLMRLFEDVDGNEDRERRVNPGELEHHNERRTDEDRKTGDNCDAKL